VLALHGGVARHPPAADAPTRPAPAARPAPRPGRPGRPAAPAARCGPGSTSSCAPSLRVLSTGRRCVQASRITLPSGSWRDGQTNRSASA
jgi:hypothetical protein